MATTISGIFLRFLFVIMFKCGVLVHKEDEIEVVCLDWYLYFEALFGFYNLFCSTWKICLSSVWFSVFFCII